MDETKETRFPNTRFTTTSNYQDHSIYLLGEIGPAINYTDTFNLLRNAAPEDNVILYINSIGGHFWTAVEYITAIKQCKGHVTVQIDGTAHSAASMICLAADSWVIPETASMMCHFLTAGYGGKMHEIGQWHEHTQPHFEMLMRKFYEGFLTVKEIDEMIGGKDLWFDGRAIKNRIQKLAKHQEKVSKKHFNDNEKLKSKEKKETK